jgi:hypothetical protein
MNTMRPGCAAKGLFMQHGDDQKPDRKIFGAGFFAWMGGSVARIARKPWWLPQSPRRNCFEGKDFKAA